ncbi:helix-turn-helix transcriptional regulator [Vibrio navarrensis]|nr:helix-turn-helix transcriptional regulator [Vibrio navarrensis]
MPSSDIMNSRMTSNMYQQLLALHDIYFVAFDREEKVVASNYPVATLSLQTLDDLVFLVGPLFISQIRAMVRGEVNQLSFDIANLHFSICLLHDADYQPLYCLQIESKEKVAIEPKLSAIEQDYQIIHELTESLSLLSQSGTTQLPDELQQEIRSKHLPEVERRLSQLQDPSLKLCLEIVKTNMENLLQEGGAINSRLLEVLTPSELQVAEFIRSGMSSQEIASTLNVARKTVENHRNSLRNKLGITNRGVNLRNYLLSLEKR